MFERAWIAVVIQNRTNSNVIITQMEKNATFVAHFPFLV